VSVPELEFDVELQAGGPSGRTLMIELPTDPKPVSGSARAEVTAQVDDHAPFATTLAVMGGTNLFGLSQDRIAEFGVAAGQSVRVRPGRATVARRAQVAPLTSTGPSR
jgi:hypothetical protein